MKKTLRALLAFIITALCSCSPTRSDNAATQHDADSMAISRQVKDTLKPGDGTYIVPDSGNTVNGPNYRGRALDSSRNNTTVQDKYPAKDGVKR